MPSALVVRLKLPDDMLARRSVSNVANKPPDSMATSAYMYTLSNAA